MNSCVCPVVHDAAHEVELKNGLNKTILMVTHDPVVAARAHTTLHLEKGVLVEGKASPQTVMAGGAA